MYNKSLLRNGALLLTEKVPYFKSLCIGVWVRIGSRQDGLNKSGLAHLVEHMMFKESNSKNSMELARQLDATGAEFDAATSREYTYFILNLPVKELEFALFFLKQLFLNPEFTQEDLEQEKKIISHEIRSIQENPEEYIDDILMKKAYKNHPMGNPILGTKKILASLDTSDVAEFFHKHYRGENIFISAVGDMNHDHLERSLDEVAFGSSSKLTPIESFSGMSHGSPSLPLKFYPGVYSMKRNLEQSHILIAYEAYPIQHPKRWAIAILNSFLGSGESSKLFQLVREESGLAYNVYSYVVSYTDTGLFIVYLATDANSLQACLSLVKNQLDAVTNNMISDNDLDLMKSSLKNSMLLDEDSAENKMMDMSKEEIFLGEYWNYQNIFSRINRVTAEDVLEVAQEIFSKSPVIIDLSKSDNSSSKIKKIFSTKA